MSREDSKVKQIKKGLRLNTPTPKVIKSLKDYSRKRNKIEMKMIKEYELYKDEGFLKNIK